MLEHLVGSWAEQGGLPARVVVRERTERWLGAALRMLGIEVVVSERRPMMEPAQSDLGKRL